MSDQLHVESWWQASDVEWYPPEQHPDYRPPPPAPDATAPAAPLAGRRDTRASDPESVWSFLGNLLVSTLFPIFALWFVTRYLMRRDFAKAAVCALPLVIVIVIVISSG